MPSAGQAVRAAGLATPLALLLAGVAFSGEAADSAAARAPGPESSVTYVTTTSAYLDAGGDAGLRVGQVVDVYRDGQLVTQLQVTAISSTRAACRRMDPAVEVRAGDRVRLGSLPPAPEAPPPVAAPLAPQPPRSHRSWLREHGMRGRVELRYVGLFDDSEFGRGYSEPAMDVRMDGDLGRGVRIGVDARARRTYRTGEEFNRTRVYRFAGEWSRGPTGPHAVLGRQLSTSVSSVSVFDGVLAEWRGTRWSAGGFSGTQPDPLTYGLATDIREHGVYGELGALLTASLRWRCTLAAIGSYGSNGVDREYLALHAFASNRRFDVYALQEADLNREWKADAGENPVSLTSALVSARVRFAERWIVDGGSDTRRRIRLYRDRITPETEFDDAYRFGHWGGLEFRPTPRSSIAANARRSSGGGGGAVDSYTMRVGAGVPNLLNLDIRTRGTWYSSDTAEGWLASGDLSVDATPRLRLGTTAGLRREAISPTPTPDDVVWYSGEVDLNVGSNWLFLASAERSHGDLEQTTQVQTSLSYRF